MLHQDQWVDIPPVPGALVINIGDLMQASFSFISVLMAE
jgi:isopenicillin N synthase-like dioxygenase